MCTNYRRTKGYAELRDDFAQLRLPLVSPPPEAAPNLEPQPEIRPTVKAVVLRPFKDGVELVQLRWGLIPSFHRGTVKEWRFTTVNARAETIATQRSYREPFKHRRCLIAGEGWVEWKGEGKPKPKFFIEPRDGEPICFAGIWDRCDTADAGPVESFSMVTQPPGALSVLHDRAPVVLRQGDWMRWLDTSADVSDLLTAEPPDLYTVRPFGEVGSAPQRSGPAKSLG